MHPSMKMELFGMIKLSKQSGQRANQYLQKEIGNGKLLNILRKITKVFD